MKNIRIVCCILSLLPLSACTNTWEGVKRDAKDTSDWAHYRPSDMERREGPAPVGYASRARVMESVEGGIYAPPATYASSAEGLVWHNIGTYDAYNPPLPHSTPSYAPIPLAAPASPSIVKYGANVSVFPVDGDIEPYSRVDQGLKPSGQMVQQIFFGYGSAKVAPVDRTNIRELAQSLERNAASYSLNVVGHASKRVDHVKDPVRKQMINLEMAQKRANAVTSELKAAGAKPQWISATSKGDREPNRRRGDKTQEAADRRVEIYMDGGRSYY
jgi:outer membrane protein OmpA-like peptidoglycan-associated protein